MNDSVEHARKAARWQVLVTEKPLHVTAFTLLAFLLSISLCACNSSQAHNAASGSEAGTSSSRESASSDAESESAASEKASPLGTYQLDDSNDEYLSYGFSEGRSWVSFSKSGNYYVGVIDEDGNLVYQINLDELQAGAKAGTNGFSQIANSVDIRAFVRTSFFDNGTAWLGLASPYSLNNGEQMSVGWAEPGFIVIDKDGNELFSSDDGDDSTELTMLGSGAGMFVVKEHIEDFSHNDDYIYVTDSQGTLLTERIECPSDLNSKFTYFGEGIFASSYNGYVWNMNNGSLLKCSSTPSVPFYEGRSISTNEVVVTPDDYATEDAIAAVKGRAGNGMFGKGLGLCSDGKFASWGEGLIFCIPYDRSDSAAYGWYNLDGELVVPMPDFGEGVSVRLAGSFSGGYAPLELKGRDGESYVTVVDANGNAQYEPIKATLLTHDEGAIYNGPGNSCANGYYAITLSGDGKSVIADADGKTYEVGVDDLSGMGMDAILPCYVDSEHRNGQFTRYASLIMGGYAYFGDHQSNSYSSGGAKFVSLDGKRVMDECYEYAD